MLSSLLFHCVGILSAGQPAPPQVEVRVEARLKDGDEVLRNGARIYVGFERTTPLQVGDLITVSNLGARMIYADYYVGGSYDKTYSFELSGQPAQLRILGNELLEDGNHDFDLIQKVELVSGAIVVKSETGPSLPRTKSGAVNSKTQVKGKRVILGSSGTEFAMRSGFPWSAATRVGVVSYSWNGGPPAILPIGKHIDFSDSRISEVLAGYGSLANYLAAAEAD